MVHELVSLGYSADKAVQIAYKTYPIMEMLEAPLTADMVENFNKAYHSVLTPLSVVGHSLLITLLNQLARLWRQLGRATA